jgi:hypothetical protein
MFIVVVVVLQESSMIDHNHHAIELQLELTRGVYLASPRTMLPMSTNSVHQAHPSPEILLRIVWCSQSGDCSQSNLIKFGYILNMKVRKKPKSFNIIGYLLDLL